MAIIILLGWIGTSDLRSVCKLDTTKGNLRRHLLNSPTLSPSQLPDSNAHVEASEYRKLLRHSFQFRSILRRQSLGAIRPPPGRTAGIALPPGGTLISRSPLGATVISSLGYRVGNRQHFFVRHFAGRRGHVLVKRSVAFGVCAASDERWAMPCCARPPAGRSEEVLSQ